MPKTVALLSAENHSENELADIGARYSAARLGAGAKTILGYAKADDTVLAGFGFGAPWRATMIAEIKALAAAKNARLSKQSAARPSGASTAAAFADCEAFVKHAHAVIAALPHGVSSQAPATPHNGQRPATIAATVRALGSFFAAHDAETKAFGGGKKLGMLGEALATKYEDTRAVHKTALADVKPEVRALHQKEGLVAAELERLSQVAHHALPAARAKLYATTTLRPRPSGKRNGAGKAKSSAGMPAASAAQAN